MRRLAILLTIGILWLGGLHPDFAVADDHHAAGQGQTESKCNGADSMEDNHCLARHNNSMTFIVVTNFEHPSPKGVASYPNNSLLVSHEGQQIRQKFLENKLIDGIKLTGTVIKRE